MTDIHFDEEEVTAENLPPDDNNGNDRVSPAESDDALALIFTNRHGNELRYVHKWGSWLQWNGSRWVFEKTLAAFDLARKIAREEAPKCNDPDDSKRIVSASTIAAIERLAKSDRKHAATTDIWDDDPWLLNTPGGIVDLRTGKLGPHDPEKYMTKMTSVAPGSKCPLWMKVIDTATSGDKEVQAFLKRVAGSALIGRVLDHFWLFFWGPGGNGKGVFIDTIIAVMSDYAYVAPMEMFVVTQGERHPTDLASLRGARLVTAQETEENQVWAEAKLKNLTGGGKITAHFMRQDPFEYQPQFNLWFAGQHRPSLQSVDEAHRRRANIIPFLAKPAKPDRFLLDKLKGEHSGILAWMIEGALEYQLDGDEGGLRPPDAVRKATENYLNAQDVLGRWIADCCVTGGKCWEIVVNLFTSYLEWCRRNDERQLSKKMFGIKLQNRGFTPGKENDIRGYVGIAIKPLREPGDDEEG